MIERIKSYLDSLNLKFWTLVQLQGSRDEIYTVGSEIESIRKVKDSFFVINVFVDHDNYTGNSGVKLPFRSSWEEAKALIDKSVKNAKHIKNPFYRIDQEKYKYQSVNNSIDVSAINHLREIITVPNSVDLSSSEYFLNNFKETFFNSAGNSYELERGSIILDKVFLSKDHEVESQFMLEFADIDHVDIDELVKNQAKFTVDSLAATLPVTGRYKVVFTGEVLENFFDFFRFHALGSNFYNKTSIFKRDEKVTDMDLTIHSQPFIKGLDTRPADLLGYPMKDFVVLENGVLKNIIANNRYSQYLQIPFTGELGNFVIEPGKLSYDDMIREEGTLVVSKISTFSPRELTGDFSAEIRLAYLNKDGKQIPLKGGSFSGNLRDFKEIFLSKEVAKFNHYIGPKAVALEGVSVAG